MQHQQTFLHLKKQENFPDFSDVTSAAAVGSAANTTRPRR